MKRNLKSRVSMLEDKSLAAEKYVLITNVVVSPDPNVEPREHLIQGTGGWSVTRAKGEPLYKFHGRAICIAREAGNPIPSEYTKDWKLTP